MIEGKRVYIFLRIKNSIVLLAIWGELMKYLSGYFCLFRGNINNRI